MNIPFILMVIINYLMAMLAMAFYTLLERKCLAYYQLRKGPNKVGVGGLPQPLADAAKLFTKEYTTPLPGNNMSFMASPAISLMLALILWSLYPYQSATFFMKFGLLLFLCVSSLNVYTILGAGWSSNSKYALLGAVRGVAQTISYEVSMALILIAALCVSQSFNVSKIISESQTLPCLMMMPLLITWFITCLAETSRTPFDLAEGESELVSGFNTEFSGSGFAFIFMAEYANIIIMSLLTAAIFLVMNFNIFITSLLIPITTTIISLVFIWIRATMPRIRYDHLMYFTWKSLLPLAITLLLMNSILVILTK
uniref:NADH dehydrogenase subunit 1 n=1 Tax=Asychis amphiglyptus TaxID=1931186 RepID=UPI0022DCD8B0|nr:NADH dehydrogenase subunit 1 [Asychis amphiglyptus]UZZ45812.1 NADH dehydrogenase subunit 1 [Asychis amphiglyptus]